jgi:ABC-2 type transport system ATP-binding protein
MEAVITVNNFKKSYGNVDAVKGISFEIFKGEMFGLVGPDGAGKTTTIRSLCGLLNADEGDITLLNNNLVKNKKEIQTKIGYLSQKFSLYGDLSVDENIEFFADIHGVDDYKTKRNSLLEFTRLINFRDRLADKLSGGMKQKLALACCMIHTPQILFLDEPTTGVDPVSRRDFWKILSNLQSEGITILMSTPYLDEAERCNRVALINKGKIISLDLPQKIKESVNKVIIEIVCTDIRSASGIIKRNSNFEVQLFGDRINVIGDSEEAYHEILKILDENKVKVIDYRVTSPSLENVFIHLVEEDESRKIEQ